MTLPLVTAFFEPKTFSVCYVVSDPASKRCAVIDAVLDYEPRSGRTATKSADEVIGFVRGAGLTVDWVLETHLHADHVTAAPHVKQCLGGRIGIGKGVSIVQATFARIFNVGGEFRPDGSQYDHLFADGETFAIGELTATVISTPGHTPACITYAIGDAMFIGDTMFMPDYGTARCDFPGGDAAILFASIRKLLAMPPATRVFVGHDYGAEGRSFAWETTVGEQRAKNKHVHEGVSEAAFVAMRQERDKQLSLPELILPAIQINMRAGAFPTPEANGVSYLKIPLNAV